MKLTPIINKLEPTLINLRAKLKNVIVYWGVSKSCLCICFFFIERDIDVLIQISNEYIYERMICGY